MITILDTVIPGKPPGINEMYINVPGRGRALTSTARKWKGDIGNLVRHAAIENYPFYMDDDLRLEIIWFWPNLYQRDIDGPVKLVQDAVCEALLYKDKHVVELHVTKLRDSDERFAILLTTV